MTCTPRKFLVFLAVLLAGSFLIAQEPDFSGLGYDKVPTGHDPNANSDEYLAATDIITNSVTTGNGINYHGGPVLKGSVPIYLILYGNWTNGPHSSDRPASVTLFNQFVNGISGSGYERINSTYGDATGNVSGNMHVAGQTTDANSQGTNFNSNSLVNIVTRAINNRSLPKDPNGVYVVLTSSDVNEPGFCTRFCGFHTRSTIAGTDIKFAFVGNADRCGAPCGVQKVSPNNDPGADATVDVIAHETEEAISDPDLNAWSGGTKGGENADKCAHNPGPTQTLPSGAKFNQIFGGHHWLIQMNWENSRGGGCTQTLGGAFH